MWIVFTILLGILYTEIVGYIVHRVIHSERFPALSRSHMIHHLKQYGPKMPMRSDEYLRSTEGRSNVGGIGFEWLAPIAMIFLPTVALMMVFGVGWIHQLLFYVFGIGWGILGFNYMHDALHIKNFWMLKIPMLSRWFKNIRRLHDIHHVKLTDEGKMNHNFGIMFFFLDRMFGTFARKAGKFNEKGLEKTKSTYAYIYEPER